ncbi:methyltransferase domain-containing protein [Thioalkalivibrio sulfidiphilus]|uniref:Tellurite resistance methyltransferase, TehB, core n=1 Tax=Thioalkalivibrio sulfidiphilus (strain HL-EbGR7) TaxID=396588 RepID=B8GU19_THISH|nr:methyltransferase domain-containing protein [Thioalkalivibrio sulfidiphilus]ACL71302.1 Tellurite resistance methyltransferase, TehB, core [Thioalkalivibrio sulfidiphilus HL-EbGr7]
MTTPTQDKWDARYRDADVAQASACRVLTEFAHLLPEKGRALDLASGLGGNARLLAQYGLDTEAWDISPVAADKLNVLAQAQSLPLQARVRDVEQSPPEPESYNVIVVSRFLDRARVPALIDALRPGGLLFYETFTREAVDATGPSDPAFRLAPNELLQLFAPLRLVAYREEGVIGDTSRGWRNEAYLVGVKTG